MTTRDGKSWIQTYSGKRFELFEPRVEDVDIVDIAHALSNLCRYTGHCKEFYSVAEHSWWVSFRAEALDGLRANTSDFSKRHAARWGLLHDAAEAYTNDLSRPLKHQPELALYREVEDRIMGVIAERFGLIGEPLEIKKADDEMLWTEARDLMSPIHPDWKATAKTVQEPLSYKISGMCPRTARSNFLARFANLF